MMGERALSRRRALQASLAVGAGAAAAARASAPAAADEEAGHARPDGSYARNTELVGFTDMDRRPALKMAVREVAGRWYLYTGHQQHGGWSIVDVTDPARPRMVRFIKGPAHTLTLQMDLHGDTMVTALEKIFPEEADPDPGAPYEEGVLIWDIADPVRPRRLGHFRTGGTGTHRNLYPGGRYVHLAAGMPGHQGNIYVILDIADRSRPREAGRWWVPGQREDEAALRDGDTAWRPGHPAGCCAAPASVSLHGPPYPTRDGLVYLPYGGAGLIVLDISDVSRPRPVGRLSFSPPFHDHLGVHGVLPVPERGIAFANSENITYGEGPAHHASIVDISDPRKPYLLSLFPEPVPPPGAPYEDFTTRGGWRGPHNINHHQHHPAVRRQDGLFYIAHFNAGLRIYDVSNKRLPREVGFYMPPDPKERLGMLPVGDLVLQTDDVVVDRRGFIYISHKNDGVYIVRYTGPVPKEDR
ncbi:hypothetical protein H0H10_00760 [Streptomyces sp. TRM S81-3]|uniref:LVIVD repeat-containing protein n=2 Tax=Streptomyces griseicoloratus TaxID=2752516 RepID=A0A926KZP8_9ACTN|nr:hypothetical protein [Streptomyces griseicoloratus]